MLDFGTDCVGDLTGKVTKDTDTLRRASFFIDGYGKGRLSYAAFAVVRPLVNPMPYSPFTGYYISGMTDMDMGFGSGHLSSEAGGPVSTHTRWSIDGEVVDPTQKQSKLCQTTDFFVLALSSTDRPFEHDTILQNRYTTSNPLWYYNTYAGQSQIAELITYHRPLSEQEVRNTEAYLLKKWLKKDHPDAADTAAAKIEFADGAERKIVTDVDKTLDASALGNGAIAKSGDGDLTLTVPEDLSVTNFPSVTVEGGTLQFDYAGGMDSERIAFLRFDPNVAEKLTTKETSVGGIKSTEMIKMYEADGRLVWDHDAYRSYYLETKGCATAGVGDGQVSLTNPTVQTVSFPVGDMKVIDYGPRSGYAKTAQNQQSAATQFRTAYYFRNPNIRDSFIIWKDRPDDGGNYGVPFFGIGPWNTTPYNRGLNWAISSNGSTYPLTLVSKGYVSLDGVEVPCTTAIPSGFHLVSFSLTNDFTKANMIGNHCNGPVGGCAVGEILIFSNQLPRVQHQYVAAKLMKKWFGKHMATNVAEVGALALANGGTFSLKNDQFADGDGLKLACASLSGNGTVDVDELDGLANIAVSFRDRETTDLLTVSGTAKLAAAGTITITVPAGINVRSGEYTLFEAEALEGTLTGWNFVLDGTIRRNWTVRKDGNAIKLLAKKQGMVISIQ